jgi:hypothetical protein
LLTAVDSDARPLTIDYDLSRISDEAVQGIACFSFILVLDKLSGLASHLLSKDCSQLLWNEASSHAGGSTADLKICYKMAIQD